MSVRHAGAVGRGAGTLEPNTVVDHFRILRRVGTGGMGEVYLARDMRLGRRVALKVIHARLLGSAKAVQGFLVEARITARFNHPHIVTVYAVGEHAGRPYLALEYLEGQTLTERLRDERPGQPESLRIGLAVAGALQEAHSNQVLHRDLKPANVLIPKDGRIRVVDFGISKVVAGAGGTSSASAGLTTADDTLPFMTFVDSGELSRVEPVSDDAPTTVVVHGTSAAVADAPTKTVLPGTGAFSGEAQLVTPGVKTALGKVVGTPGYVSPERWRGAESTEAADIWALGMLLYQLIAGRHPYQGLSPKALLESVMSAEPVPSIDPRIEVAPGVLALVNRCLDKDPMSRPSAAEVAQELQELLPDRRDRRSAEHSPFRGLRAFEERHADQFYGRDDEVLAFVERLRETPILPVVGASGAGKSSFVKAGVIPRLREQGSWLVLKLRPGGDPFVALARVLLIEETSVKSLPAGPSVPMSPAPEHESVQPAGKDAESEGPQQLAGDEQSLVVQLAESPTTLSLQLYRLADHTSSKVLLFVDQLEELYTMVADGQVRRRFMRALYAAADDRFGPVRVVFTLREDFLSRLAEGVQARETLSHVTVMRSPGAEALGDILARPLEGTGYRYEDAELTEDLVRDVRHEPACLPLLAFAAQTLWERRDKAQKLLLRASYEVMGGVGGALAEHADGVLQGMSAGQVQLARQILLRLVTVEGTRRVATRQQVLEGLDVEAKEVLARLTEARLISARKGRGAAWGVAKLELVHEALIQRWRQLAQWLDESREDLSFLAEVGQAAELWEKRGRPVTEVWHDEALADAERKARRCQNVPRQVQAFLGAGVRRARGKTRRRRFLWAAAMTLLTTIALAAVGVSVVVSQKEREAQVQRRQAQIQHRRAEIREREAVTQRAEAQQAGARAALVRGDPLEARARLRLALEIRDSRLARSLWWRLVKHPLLWKKQLGAMVYKVAFSPDGKTVAAACMDRAVYLFDTRTGGVRILRGHVDQVFAVAFSPDGRHLASGTWGGEVRLWDLGSGRFRALRGHTRGVFGVSFSPDGALLASGSGDKTVRLWQVKTGRAVGVLRGHEALLYQVSFSPDGALLASGSGDKTVRLWDVKARRQIAVLRGHRASVRDVSFSPRGAQLASGSIDKTVRVWNVKTRRQTVVLRGHQASVYGVSFKPGGAVLASGSEDKTVRLWDVKTGRQTAVFRGHGAGVDSVAFGPAGALLASGGVDKTVRLWEVKSGRQTAPGMGHQASVYSIAFGPRSAVLASGSVDKTVRLWDVKTGRQTAVLRGHRATVFGVSLGPGGARVASGSFDKTVRLWDVKTGCQTAVLRGHQAHVQHVAFSPGGALLASGSVDKTVRLWSVKTGRQTAVLRGHQASVLGLSFSPDGALLASGSADKTVRLWGVKTGRQTAVLRGHLATVYGVSFSPGGAMLASGSGDKTVRIWSAKTRKGRVLGRGAGRIYSVHFHPDQTRVATTSSDGTARIWNLSTGKHVDLRGHRAEVNAVRFSPDGKLIATSSDDGTVRLWQTDTGWPIWRAPLLRPKTLALFTHRGWIRLNGQRSGAPPVTPARWRTAVEKTARVAAESPDGTLLCLSTHNGTLEIWDVVKDRRLAVEKVSGLSEVVALPSGCVTLAHGIARRHSRAGVSKILRRQATSIAWDAGARDLLVVAGSRVWVYGPQLNERGRFPTDAGATAVGRVGEWIAVGFQDGNIELMPTRAGQTKPTFTFEGVGSAAVVRIIPGPRGTLIAGYANGMLGLWSQRNGALLEHARLHGAVVHLVIRGTRLFAASALGQHMTWDLSMFHIPYCDLLRQVWKDVPLVWKAGLPELRAPPVKHRCQ